MVALGDYKLSVHPGSDKLPVYPIAGCYAFGRSDTDRATCHVATDLNTVLPPEAVPNEAAEAVSLDENNGRQFSAYHVQFHPLSAGHSERFRDHLSGILDAHEEDLCEALGVHFHRLLEGFGQKK